ncbi:unnamed protein product [Rangifer tarandus platyrhynchus]|uniref:Uncharacterized protein n=2 Tax=Rangifer tarandus platyrhynchus TaxID=3082113 RepID=A0ACB0FNL8_RANTA|nr:unnamed protein product [Rangifer tarandus platyrhynchus]CAI9714183.1 unnamed protein product [Rangifer tarandus platyrhynchus]
MPAPRHACRPASPRSPSPPPRLQLVPLQRRQGRERSPRSSAGCPLPPSPAPKARPDLLDLPGPTEARTRRRRDALTDAGGRESSRPHPPAGATGASGAAEGRGGPTGLAGGA